VQGRDVIGGSADAGLDERFANPIARARAADEEVIDVTVLILRQLDEIAETEPAARGPRRLAARVGATTQEIRVRRLDVGAGTLFSNLVMYFIILATAITLHRHGLTHPQN